MVFGERIVILGREHNSNVVPFRKAVAEDNMVFARVFDSARCAVHRDGGVLEVQCPE